jgi:multiple sugar transport system substrate-binding protein
VGALVIIGIIVFIVSRLLGGGARQSVSNPPSTGNTTGRTTVPGEQTTITYWGLWEPNEVMSQIFDEFEQQNPGVQVEYVKQSPQDYRERLQTAIAAGRGPDVFRYHATWVPMLRNELSPVPNTIYTAADFQRTFYPVVAKQLQLNGQYMGIPLMYDGLALYYNEDILRTAGATPPTTWAELRTLAAQLTVRSENQIQRGGLAIGNATNVEHYGDIIGLLMLQNGADPTNPTTAEARDALLFYTNFAKVDQVWDENLPNSTVAFSRGDAAMMFAPSWRALEVKALNPDLKFAIAPLPKLGENRTAWASYWAEGVSSKSTKKDMSWNLLKYLSSADVMKRLYSAQAATRPFGEPYSRVDLANELANDPIVSPFLADAPDAEGWYLSTATHDNGINDQLLKYYQDAVTAILDGKTVDQALQAVSQGTTQVLRQYGVTTTTAP